MDEEDLNSMDITDDELMAMVGVSADSDADGPTQKEIKEAFLNPLQEELRLPGHLTNEEAERIAQAEEEAQRAMWEATAGGEVESDMSTAGLIEMAAATAGGVGVPALFGRRYGKDILSDVGTAAVASLGSGAGEQIAIATLESVGIKDPKNNVQRIYDAGGNVVTDMVLELGMMGAGRLSSVPRMLINKTTGFIERFNPDYALVRAFVDNPRQFSDWLNGTGIGSDAIPLEEAFKTFRKEVLNKKRAGLADFTKATKIFGKVKVMFTQAQTKTGASLDNILVQVREKQEEAFDRIISGPARVRTDAPSAVSETAMMPKQAALPGAPEVEVLPPGTDRLRITNERDLVTQAGVPGQIRGEVPRKYKYQVGKTVETGLETIPAKGPRPEQIDVEVSDIPTGTTTVYDRATELPVTFDFELRDFGLEELYEIINSRAIATADEWIADPKLRTSVIDSERGSTSITKKIREELDGLYRKHDLETFNRLLAAEKLLKSNQDKLFKLRERHASGEFQYLTDKQLENIDKQIQMLSSSITNNKANIGRYKETLGDIVITGEEAIRIKRAWDAISQPQLRAAAANLEGRLGYEAYLTMANRFRTVIGERITEIDPDLGKQWKNLNELYSSYKRIEPFVNLRAMQTEQTLNFTPRSADDTNFVTNFFSTGPIGAFQTAMGTVGAEGQLVKPLAEAVRAGARGVYYPMAMGAKVPGAAAGLSGLPAMLGGPDVEQWADSVLNFGLSTTRELMKVEEAEAQQSQMLSEAQNWKQTRNQYVVDLLNGAGNSKEYALAKARSTRGDNMPAMTVMPEEEPEETPKVEMEDTGLGTKKRK